MKRQCLADGLALFASALAALLFVAAVSAKDTAPPDEPGPFNVGVTTFSATMTGGRVTRVQVFYPTFEPPDPAFRYTILWPPGTPGYRLRSPLGAAEDAQALPGRFPLVVHNHGGPTAGADFQRTHQFPLHELMASHGFVTVVALHSSNTVTSVRELLLVIDLMLARSADHVARFFDTLDPV